MKSLSTLLRIARADLDLLRRVLADQIAKELAVEARIRGLDRALLTEQEAALRDFESQRAYGTFAMFSVISKRAAAAERIAIGQESDRLRTLIAEAHVEMRKFERLIELAQARARAAQEKREDAELDELTTLRARAFSTHSDSIVRRGKCSESKV